jgi:hypothetical protein
MPIYAIVGFETTISVLERSKAVRVIDRADSVNAIMNLKVS